MKTTIDGAGRVVIPKRIRDQAGLTPGAEIEVRYCDGHVEVEASAAEVVLEERDGFLVAVPIGPTSVLTNEMVEELIRQDREERLDYLSGMPTR